MTEMMKIKKMTEMMKIKKRQVNAVDNSVAL
jgi:hypothetical protein